MLAGKDADVAQVMRDPARALVEVAIGQAAVAGDQRDAIRYRVGHGLEQVGEVELHRATLPSAPTHQGRRQRSDRRERSVESTQE